ncbi:high mobility group protein B3, putative [Entamoeba invadens IP1]|uniref:High mobility group protein B3, putative n=1 Tax=Entamoeba invadens IP1 TaxID=370355 RepID=L7FK00_ENTIV|nr:high mobility group protein B3, putative [Entamoeba invadens IP1]ELP84880.1 high mobility group protein B3, putative [Entamoeba invadens IP1]|eukprot:XP_004184226.1 high mobility group protein B3, putative [Entamoeba invadens IP1]
MPKDNKKAKKVDKKAKVEKEKKPKKEKDPNKPKKPASAYLLYCQEVRPSVKEKNPEMKQKDILGVIGKMWKDLSESEKKKYTDMYDANKKVYEEQVKADEGKAKED